MVYFKNIRISVGLSVLAVATFSSVVALAQTPIFDAIEQETAKRSDPEKVQQCLLSARVIHSAAENTKLMSSTSKKAIRAKESMLKLELSMRGRYQTDFLFSRAISEVKAEYDLFKSTDKKQQKELFSLAKGINKECGRRVERLKLHRMNRSNHVAEQVPAMSSENAELCNAAIFNSMNSREAIVAGLPKILVWNEVFRIAKRTEGFPDNELIRTEKGALDASKEKLKGMGPESALALHKACDKKYEEASFKAKLTEKSEEEFEYTSVVDWD